MMNRATLACLSFCALSVTLASSASAGDLFVSPTGNDANPGTASSPFQTIGKCAATALPGDTCRIAAGSYPELVKPARSGTAGKPITFAASPAFATATLSGRRVLSGWTKHAGSIWKTTVTDDFGELFVDGVRMVIARWPNLVGGDVYRPTFNLSGGPGGTTFFTDPTHLTQPAGYWSGAKLYLVPGLGWAADQVSVSAYDPAAHRIDFSPAIGFSCCYTADKESRYFLYDKLELLDAPSEWYLDRAAHVAYAWLPDGSDPSAHVVEASSKPAGFDLTGLSEIHIEGLTIASGTLVMSGSNKCRVDGCRVLYSHTATGTGFSPGGLVDVSGADNEIVRSEIAYAPGRCVYLGGTRNALRSSHVHHCDELATYDQIVKIGGKANVVEDCSLHDTGRDGIGMEDKSIDGSIVQHNELSNTCLIAKDCGGFYVYKTDGVGSVVRYNVVHDVWPAPTEAYGGIHLGMGIYFDDGCSNFVAHHNVVYKIGHNGIFLHQPSRGILVYNNTTVGSGGGASSALDTAPGGGGPDATGSIVANDLAVLLDGRDGWCLGIEGATPAYHHNGYFQSSGKGRNNSVGVEATGVVGDPLFEDATAASFALRAGSPMIDKGVVIAGITDGYVGAAPDIGAYERGATELPGPRGAVGPPPVPTTDAGAPDADGGSADGGSPSDARADDAPNDGDLDASTDGDVDAALVDAPTGDASGCGCRVGAGGGRASGSMALLALVAAAWGTSRRSKRRRGR